MSVDSVVVVDDEAIKRSSSVNISRVSKLAAPPTSMPSFELSNFLCSLILSVGSVEFF